MLTDEQQADKKAFIQAIRDQLDWLESRQDLPKPYACLQFDWLARDKADFIQLRKAAGLSDKIDREEWLAFEKRFSHGGVAYINIKKEKTCNRVKVGTKVIPAQPEQEIDVYEWRCEEPILASTAAAEFAEPAAADREPEAAHAS